jgi:hypothetical protein
VGETIEIVADLKKNKFIWLSKGSQFAECSIPLPMKNKVMFFSLLLYWSDDEVDLFI